MEFGIFSKGIRHHTTAAETNEEDLQEIILADKLGFRDCYISEHHGEPPYIGRVDTIPTPELLICKAAGLTKHIRMGAAVKLLHIHHPLDIAIQAAVTEHLVGAGRFIFGFGFVSIGVLVAPLRVRVWKFPRHRSESRRCS